MWAILSAVFGVASLCINKTFPLVFLFLVPGLVLQAAGTWAANDASVRAGAALLLLCCLPAIWALWALFLNGVMGEPKFGLGQPILRAGPRCGR